MENKPNDEVSRLTKLFSRAKQSSTIIRKYKKECEEFYISDHERTLSMFTEKQKGNIEATYNIPVSIKISHAIVEQMLSFLTATKPFPRYVAPTDNTADFAMNMQNLFHACFYESKGNMQIVKALRDMLTTGDGWLRVRKVGYYDESTTNTVIEYIPWKKVFVDPETTEVQGITDAQYAVVVNPMTRSKAEKVYNVKIKAYSHPDTYSSFIDGLEPGYSWSAFFHESDEDKKDIVIPMEFYECEEINVYVSDEGYVSTKRPIPTEIENEERKALIQQLQGQQANAEQLQQSQQMLQSETMDMNNPMMSDVEASGEFQQLGETEELQEQGAMMQQGATQDILALSEQIAQMPTMLPAFEMEVENYTDEKNPEKIIVNEVTLLKKKRIKYTLLIGDKIHEKRYIPCAHIPLINFVFKELNDINRTLGMVHLMQDTSKAYNKYISMLMDDIATHGHRKGVVWRTTVTNPEQIANDWANPHALLFLNPDPSLPNGGMPMFLDPVAVNQSIQYMVQFFKDMIEYVTGIYGLLQGDSSQAPQTLGATSSLQNFGTQRVKMYARNLESAFEKLALVAAELIMAYCPREKVIKYFDDNGDQKEAMLLDNKEDLQLKVRVEIVSSLPTQRQLVNQILMFVAQTAGDPNLSMLLTEEFLKVADVPEALEIKEKLDVLKKMQAQLEQQQQTIEQLSKELNVSRNQMLQKDIGQQTKDALFQAQQEINDVTRDATQDQTENVQPGSDIMI
jgi:hypothetical protein